MKNRLWPSLLTAMLAFAGPAHSQDAAEMVEFEVRFVEATKKQVFDVLNSIPRNEPADPSSSPVLPFAPPPGPPPTAPAVINVAGVLSAEQTTSLFKKLREHQLTISAAPRATTLVGRRARVENVKEFRYPSAYSKPDKQGNVVPVEFETKPIGIAVELEPKKEIANTIDITLFTHLSKFKGFYEENTETAPQSGAGWQPVFKTNEVTTEITVYSGQTVLLCTSGNGDGAKEDFIFVTARKISSP